MMSRRCLVRWTLFFAAITSFAARGDDFDRIEGEELARVPRSKDAMARTSLSMAELDAIPAVLRDVRATLLIVTTDQGNFCRLLVSPAFRKPPAGKGKPVPVLVLERFDTFEAGNIQTRLARGKDLLLFDGFHVDLDSGQVVPEGQGGDLQWIAGAKDAPKLIAVGKTVLYTVTKAPISAAAAANQPSSGRAVLPGDFSGRYRFFANGQWSGTLDLKVDPNRAVTGRFRSDLNGASYPVTGQVAADAPQKITFAIKYPRAHQELEGRIWTQGKGAIAGTLTMLDHAYGFFAVREGGRFAAEGEDLGPLTRTDRQPGRRSVVLRKGQLNLDGKPATTEVLREALKQALASDPATWVLLQAPADEPFNAVQKAIEEITAAGIPSIRLGVVDPAR
jgi:hypothetical protein